MTRTNERTDHKGREPQATTASERSGAHPPILPLNPIDPAGGLVRASQPLPQPSRGFVRRRSVEGHQRGGDPRNPDDASAPAIARDGGDLDQVGVPANQFFEAVDGCAHGRSGCACCSEVLRRRELYAGVATDQAKRGTKARAQSRRARNPELRRPKKNFDCCAFHRKCTVHPQDFNMGSITRVQIAGARVRRPPARSPRGQEFGLLTEQRSPRTLETHEEMPLGGIRRCHWPVDRAHGPGR
jgi:hypothetical protein